MSLKRRAISVGISFSFSMWIEYCYDLYLAEFCICVPLIPKYVVYNSASQYQLTRLYYFTHPKNYNTFLPSLNLNPSVNLCKDRVVS